MRRAPEFHWSHPLWLVTAAVTHPWTAGNNSRNQGQDTSGMSRLKTRLGWEMSALPQSPWAAVNRFLNGFDFICTGSKVMFKLLLTKCGLFLLLQKWLLWAELSPAAQGTGTCGEGGKVKGGFLFYFSSGFGWGLFQILASGSSCSSFFPEGGISGCVCYKYIL